MPKTSEAYAFAPSSMFRKIASKFSDLYIFWIWLLNLQFLAQYLLIDLKNFLRTKSLLSKALASSGISRIGFCSSIYRKSSNDNNLRRLLKYTQNGELSDNYKVKTISYSIEILLVFNFTISLQICYAPKYKINHFLKRYVFCLSLVV